jgi:arsenite methyltransferase
MPTEPVTELAPDLSDPAPTVASGQADRSTPDDLVAQVRDHYARAAALGAQAGEAGETSCCEGTTAGGCCEGTTTGGCCEGTTASTCCGGSVDAGEGFGLGLYDLDVRDVLPQAAAATSLGCGVPTEVAALHPGEVVLDLGSGGGIDVLLSARRVGPTGWAYGLDMTPEMLDLARRNAAEAGVDNVTFVEGRIEDIPLADATVDVIISNCVINLSVDKPAVMREMARVLRPGGRLGISDVVAADHLTAEERAARGSHVGCIAGALSFQEYRDALTAVGFAAVEVVPTHAVAEDLYAAIVRAELRR